MSFTQQLTSVSGSSVSSAQLLSSPSSSSSTSPSSSMSSVCCENGRNLINPHTGQTVCSCQYSPGILTCSRMGLPEPVYASSAYPHSHGYVTLGTDQSAFYPPLNSSYDLKEAGEAWRGQHPGCYPYDPTNLPSHSYPNSYGGMDINSAARRKNATRENTNTLKAWLYEHRKNPYPTKGEKIMLAIITKMTLTQVSTWFANARRRLKKENKMTWSPRNKPGANDDDDEDNDEEGEGEDDNSKDRPDRQNEIDRGSSPVNEKKSCDREGQLSSDVTDSSSPCSTMRTVHMCDTSSSLTHLPPRGRLPNHAEHGMRCPDEFASMHLPAESSPSFLNVPLASRGYSEPVPLGCLTSPGGPMGSVTESSKRPDSLCSNSNDSLLNEANCTYSEAALEALRPKIWSLAHVATSDAGYSSHCHVSVLANSNNSSSINTLPRNNGSISQGTGTHSLSGSCGTTTHANPSFTSGHSRHDSFQSSCSSTSSSLSSFTPSPSGAPLPPAMPHWGPLYGPPAPTTPTLAPHHGKPPGQGPPLTHGLPMMVSGVHMVPSTLNSAPSNHSLSPPSCYMKTPGHLPAYYAT